MPELPEVETIARGVDARLRGDRIVEVWFSEHREPFKTPPGRQAKGLEGRTILAVHRVGKHIVCELGLRAYAPATKACRRGPRAAAALPWVAFVQTVRTTSLKRNGLCIWA